VLVRENSIPARAKRAEEHSPWVTIVMYEPAQPHFVIVSMAVSVMLMWATEE
jgi:hypothetical protein